MGQNWNTKWEIDDGEDERLCDSYHGDGYLARRTMDTWGAAAFPSRYKDIHERLVNQLENW